MKPARNTTSAVRRSSWRGLTAAVSMEAEAGAAVGQRIDSPKPSLSEIVVSVIVPVFNEERTVAEVVRRVARLPFRSQLIVVNDGSTDATTAELERLTQELPIQVLTRPKNQGKGASIREGLRYATGQIVVIQDSDLEYDPEDLVRVIEPIAAGRARVVYGSRFLRRRPASGLIHRAANRMLTRFSNLLTGQRLTDMETCYKAFRREVLQGVVIRQNRFGVEPELTAKAARRGELIHEVPISYRARGYRDGKKVGFRDGLNAIWCIIRYGLAD